jgi:SNF2 family DNA or RNA helicase
MIYKHKQKPFKNQSRVFKLSRDLDFYGLLHEQGTGKTKVLLDTAAWFYMHNWIDAVVVVAPNGVHRNWIEKEIPEHLPDDIPRKAVFWTSAKTKDKTEQLNELMTCEFEGLKFIAFNIESMAPNSMRARAYIEKFLKTHTVLFILDESQDIKNPKAKRTKFLLRMRDKYAEYRRIGTGTLTLQSPLDVFTQMQFLDKSILPWTNYYAFRAHFAYTKKIEVEGKDKRGRPTMREIEIVTGYKNLEELADLIAPYTDRVLKKDCIDIPDKVYSPVIPIELGAKQKKYYIQMREKLRVELETEEVTAALAITKLLRLQQITGGFLPLEDGTYLYIEDNNRIKALMSLLSRTPGKAIIWARFRAEIELIAKTIGEEYGKSSLGTYYGGTKADDRAKLIKAFQTDKTTRFFIGNPQSGGTGITLHAATTVIYYSNDFNLGSRLQSEDRAHRIGQHNKVTYYDFAAIGTLDKKIISVLRNKQKLASVILRDPPTNWI